MSNWTRGAACIHTTAPVSHIRPYSVAGKLLLIFRPTEGRRLSWPEHTVCLQLADGCLQMVRVRFESQAESYESDTLITRPLAPSL